MENKEPERIWIEWEPSSDWAEQRDDPIVWGHPKPDCQEYIRADVVAELRSRSFETGKQCGREEMRE